jgi:NAD(P)-dependent dehydrogenase (short-subunit alcohol dehydrogenase family)
MAEAVSLVLISGAVASGKTTLVLRVTALARVDAVTAASIDIDELVKTVAGSDWTKVTREHRLQACELAARLIDTPMGAELEPGASPDAPELAREAMQAANVMGRYGTPEEAAALVSFLCSDEASFINGGIYPIDGGGTATRS